MGDLKIENARLQKLADILDSQPELTFCIDIAGNIKFISDSALNCMKSTLPEDSDDEPNHINQILTLESVETVLESIAEIRNLSSRSNSRDCDQEGIVSSVQVRHEKLQNTSITILKLLLKHCRLIPITLLYVQSVCYHDANGFQVAGYVRCSRLVKRASFDDMDVNTVIDVGPPNKRVRAASPTFATRAAAGEQHHHPSLQQSISRQSGFASETASEMKYRRDKQVHEEEFVCVIRPADASFPYVRGNSLFSSLLSTASMVAHDLELRSSGYNNQADPLAAGWSKEDYQAAGRVSVHHSYHHSGQQVGSGSGSSNGTKNSTSSETNSEDYGEQDESPL